MSEGRVDGDGDGFSAGDGECDTFENRLWCPTSSSGVRRVTASHVSERLTMGMSAGGAAAAGITSQCVEAMRPASTVRASLLSGSALTCVE